MLIIIRAIRGCLSFTTNISNLTNVAVFIIRVIRAIRVVSPSPRISLILRMLQCFKIRVIRAIRVVYLHHELLESHECSRVYNSCDSCCLFFTTNISNLTNAAVL